MDATGRPARPRTPRTGRRLRGRGRCRETGEPLFTALRQGTLPTEVAATIEELRRSPTSVVHTRPSTGPEVWRTGI